MQMKTYTTSYKSGLAFLANANISSYLRGQRSSEILTNIAQESISLKCLMSAKMLQSSLRFKTANEQLLGRNRIQSQIEYFVFDFPVSNHNEVIQEMDEKTICVISTFHCRANSIWSIIDIEQRRKQRPCIYIYTWYLPLTPTLGSVQSHHYSYYMLFFYVVITSMIGLVIYNG